MKIHDRTIADCHRGAAEKTCPNLASSCKINRLEQPSRGGVLAQLRLVTAGTGALNSPIKWRVGACVAVVLGLLMSTPQATADDASSNSLWPRLQAQLTLQEHYDHPKVQKWARDFSSRPHELRTLVNRSKPYLYHIVDRIEAAGVPGEIALIPFMESGFDPFAYSEGRAAGLWQFMSPTAKRFGLRQSWWYDGRRDVTASTEAAIRYLEYLQDRYEDWTLSIGAYNAGEGRMWKAVRRAKGGSRAFWDLDLPGQTRAYVPRILALAAIIHDPARYGVRLPDVTDSPETALITLPGQVELDVVAELADISPEWIYKLNPAFNRFATDPDGPHHLLLPADRANNVAEAVKALPAQQRVRWLRHEVVAGDTLGEVAQRYDTSVSILKRINGLQTTTLRIGQELFAPTSTHATELAGLPSTHRARRGIAQYTVRGGDSLWTIARKHDMSVGQLAKLNRVSRKAVIRPGQRLRVHGKGAAQTERTVTYTVRSGDSLGSIAQRYKVSPQSIASNNGITRPDLIRPGQRLKIKLDVREQSDA